MRLFVLGLLALLFLPLVARAALTDDVRANYHFENSWEDSTGVFNLTANGAVFNDTVPAALGSYSVWTPAITDDFIQTKTPNPPQGWAQFTFVAHVILHTSGNCYLCSDRDAGGRDFELTRDGSTNKWDLSINTVTGGMDYNQVQLVTGDTEGSWTFFAATYDGSDLTFYAENSTGGLSKGTSALPEGAVKSDGGDMFYNGDYAGNADCLWNFDEITWWNRSLSAAEIDELYNSGSYLAHPFAAATTTVNWEGYDPPNATRNASTNLTFYYNLTNAGALYCELHNSTQFLANSSAAVGIDTKHYLNATELGDGLEPYQVRCLNGTTLYNSSLKYFEVDTTEPFINLYSPVLANTSAVKTGNAYVFNASFFDLNLYYYYYNVTKPDASSLFANSTLQINDTTYNYTRTETMSTRGIYTGRAKSADDHNQLKSGTARERVKNYEAETTEKGGTISALDNTIRIEPSAEDLKSFGWEYSPKDTNWQFTVETKEAKKTGEKLVIELYADQPFTTRYSSGHIGHLITGQNYVDFDGLDIVAETVIDPKNPLHVTMTLTFQSDQKESLALKSVGELNVATKSFELRVSDSPTFKTSSRTAGASEQTNETITFKLQCENDYNNSVEQMAGNCIVYNGSSAYGSQHTASLNNGTLTTICTVVPFVAAKTEVWKAEMWCNDTVSDSIKVNTTALTIKNSVATFSLADNSSPTWERYTNFSAWINLTDWDADLTTCYLSTNASNSDGNWTNRTLTCPTGTGTLFNVSTNITIQENGTGAYWWEATDGTNTTRTETYTFLVERDLTFNDWAVWEQGTFCTFNWTSNKAVTSLIYYGTNKSSLSWYAGKPAYEISHTLSIAGLNASTLYYANVTGCTDTSQCQDYIRNCTTAASNTGTGGTSSSPAADSTPAYSGGARRDLEAQWHNSSSNSSVHNSSGTTVDVEKQRRTWTFSLAGRSLDIGLPSINWTHIDWAELRDLDIKAFYEKYASRIKGLAVILGGIVGLLILVLSVERLAGGKKK